MMMNQLVETDVADHVVVESAAGAGNGLADRMLSLLPFGGGTEMSLPDMDYQLTWNDYLAGVWADAVSTAHPENTFSDL